MNNKLYIGNIHYKANEENLKDLKREFEEFGTVEEFHIIKDKISGELKGFAFVTFSDPEKAEEAMRVMSEKDFMGRPLKVKEARESEDRSGRSSYNR